MNRELITSLVKMEVDSYFKNNKVNVNVKPFDGNKEIFFPEYQTDGSAGADIKSVEDVILKPGETKAISTNLSVEIPNGFEIQIRPRSGLALKKNITIMNSPSTIDSDYRGEIKVILANFGKDDFSVKVGDRIAQMVLCRINIIEWNLVNELSITKRGEGGFGHTDKRK